MCETTASIITWVRVGVGGAIYGDSGSRRGKTLAMFTNIDHSLSRPMVWLRFCIQYKNCFNQWIRCGSDRGSNTERGFVTGLGRQLVSQRGFGTKDLPARFGRHSGGLKEHSKYYKDTKLWKLSNKPFSLSNLNCFICPCRNFSIFFLFERKLLKY